MKKWFASLLTVITTASTIAIATSCGETKNPTLDLASWEYSESIVDDKYRNFYEIYVRSFYDADGNGYGDIRGVGLKMEYIHDLGFNGIWMMPIHNSISYHKYDVDNYYSIHKEYQTKNDEWEDFDFMIEQANKYDVAIIMDLVINHSSARNKWFTDAVAGLKEFSTPGSDNKPTSACKEKYPTVDYYNFIYSATRPISGTFHSVAGVNNWWYEGHFSDNMPDLNLANEGLKSEIVDIMRFWLEKGVKGFRLDAALHFFGAGATEKNVEFLGWLESEAQKIYKDVYFVAEVWQGKEEQRYYASGLDSFFNFSNSQGGGTVLSAISKENAANYVYGVVQYQNGAKQYDAEAIVANFLCNHDMQRSANAAVKEIKREDGRYSLIIDENYVKLSLGLNQMITGTSWVYYGEEIGMLGHSNKIDQNYRTAMLWSNEEELCKNPDGSKTHDQIYDTDTNYTPGTVEEQLVNPNSILNYLKIATRLRYKYPSIARGMQRAITFPGYNEYAIIEKTYNNEKLYVLINICENVSEVKLTEELANVKVLDTLSTNNSASVLSKGVIKAAPYSITILK